MIIFLLISCGAQNKLTHDIRNELTQDSFSQSFSGLAIYDPEAKKYIFDHNSEKYFTPASNVKLLTFYAALKELQDSIPGIRYVSKNDSLIFWGTGDPSFLNKNVSSSKVFDFLKNSKQGLHLVENETSPEAFGAGWAWDDYNDSYSSEISIFPIYGNLAEFTFSENDSIPTVNPKYFQQALKFDESISKSVKRQLETNTFKYSFSENDTVRVPFKTSSELTAKLLSDTLNLPVKLIPFSKNYAEKSKVINSVASDSLYKRMLQHSDNFIAEQLLLLISEKLSDTLNSKIAINHIQKTYFQDLQDEIKWIDGSGLSRYNLITPRTLISVLEKISQEIPQEKLFELLPSGGKTGSLKELYKNEEPYVFAKTGSLRNNYNLSGFLKTRSGKVLLFSFMNNNYVVPSSEIKKNMEKILLQFYNNY